MKYISNILQSILIVTLFSGSVYGINSSEKPDPAERTLKAIEDCIERSHVPWTDEWKNEYIDMIRKAVELHRDVPHYTTRLEILRKGFEPYWQSFKKTSDRSLFEVNQARIRWYTEHLMGSELPNKEERQKLRDQYKDLWDYAAKSLIEQFPFLDPNTVEAAKAKEISICYRKIDAPLMPVYLKPMSEEQVEQIKQRWGNLRYFRVDLWRRLGGGSNIHEEKSDALSSKAERDYELSKESFSQLLGLVWMVVPQRPDYYLSALENRRRALRQRVQSKRNARSDQQRLEKECSRQLLQTEHISFLIDTLLETRLCLEGAPSIFKQE